MKVLFAGSEVVPFVKTGGLADVVGSLPKELLQQGADVRVVLPKYGSIPARFLERLEHVTSITSLVSWRSRFCGIETLVHEGVTYYFIDNEEYFKREGLYGHWDEAERFAFFSRAVLDILPHIDFQPDVIHCHDWQTGLIPVFLKTHYREHPFYHGIRTMLTIHNLKYQGAFPYSVLGDILGLGNEHFTWDGLELNGNVSYLKGGLNYADVITTVSRTYAEEIQTPYYGEQLDGLLKRRSSELYGIVNGIDYSAYDPMTDESIAVNYRDSLPKKRKNKTALQEELGLPVDEGIPMIAIVTRLVEQKGLDLIVHVLDELLSTLDVQLVVLGTGDPVYENMFRHFAWKYPNKLSAHITFNDGLARRMYAASDLFLMPSQFEPCGIGQLIALRYRSVPIVRNTGGLADTVASYNPDTESGWGFGFDNYNAHDMLYTIQKAIELYGQPQQWDILQRNIKKLDFSWQQSARQYVELYQRLSGHDVSEHAE